MIAALAVVAVFCVALIIIDVFVSRRRNHRAIETMRRQRGGLGL